MGLGGGRCYAPPSDVSETFLPSDWRVGKLFTPLIRIRELPCMNTSEGQIILTRLFVPFASHSRSISVKFLVKPMKLSCEIPPNTLDVTQPSSNHRNPLDAYCQSAGQEMSHFEEPTRYYRVHTSTQVPTNTRFQMVSRKMEDCSLTFLFFAYSRTLSQPYASCGILWK